MSKAPAGLIYVSDDAPGLTRVRSGKGFRYCRNGRAVRDKHTLDRIQKLAIPPAWSDVWISADENGHLQATGRDARGRKQHRYHARFREHRDAAKFDHLPDFAKALPALRARVTRDMRKQGLPREKVIATDDVASSLGNTPAICRKCYVHPAVLDAYEAGDLTLRKAKRAGLSAHEASVLNFLDRRRPRRRAAR